MIYILTQYGQVFTASDWRSDINAYLLRNNIPPHLYSEYRVLSVDLGGEVHSNQPLKEFIQ